MSAYSTKMSKEGRVLIPASVRQALGLSVNEPLSVYVADGEVRIVSRLRSIRQMQQRMSKLKPRVDDMVDELLRERRQAAERE